LKLGFPDASSATIYGRRILPIEILFVAGAEMDFAGGLESDPVVSVQLG
jgi:hypothetical protein